jgi:hypothetical protein
MYRFILRGIVLVVRAESPSVLPAKGAALGKDIVARSFLAGPTGRWFVFLASLKENGWPVGPGTRDSCDTFTRAAPFAGRTAGPSVR